ncbi:hypothetical protein ABK040_004071 [Willaertia magna]
MPQNNNLQQLEELEVLNSIYTSDELIPKIGVEKCWAISITPPINEDSDELITLDAIQFEFYFHSNYPNDSPPFFEIRGGKNWINLNLNENIFQSNDLENLLNSDMKKVTTIKDLISKELTNMFVIGQPIIFQWIEFLKNDLWLNIIDITKLIHFISSQQNKNAKSTKKQHKEIEIIHGEAYTEKKSKFIAHLAKVHSLEDVNIMLSQLKEDDKIANATHNICAYRIVLDDNKMLENRDDDGETGAGDQVLYLLQRLNVENCCCVVTRWFGGIKLGSDRFKIIVNVAKKTLVDHNFVNSVVEK